MNISFFYESLDLGGQQTYTLEIMRCLKDKGHELNYFFCQNPETLKKQFEEISKVIKLSTLLEDGQYRRAPWKVLFITLSLISEIKNLNTDVIISGSGLSSLICGLAAKFTGVKHYRLVGCSLKQVEPTLFRFYELLRIDKLIDVYFGFDSVFDELKEKNVAEEKFIHLPLAVNHEKFFPLKESEILSLRSTLNIDEKEIVIGWVGRICKTMQVWNTAKLGRRLLDEGFSGFKLLFMWKSGELGFSKDKSFIYCV